MPEILEDFIEKKKNEYLQKELGDLLKNKKQDRIIIDTILDLKFLNLEYAHKLYDKYSRYKNLMRDNKIIFNEYFKHAVDDYNKNVANIDTQKEFLTNSEKAAKISNALKFEDAIENFEDDMENMIINNESRKLLKSVISSKYKHLVNETTHLIFREFHVEEIERNEIQAFITQKIAQFQTPEEFNDSLTSYLNQKMGWNHDEYLDKIKNIVPEEHIYYTEDNKILFEAHNFEAAKALGSAMWCVTREKEYYDDYTNEMERLVFMYDFSKSPDDTESLTAYIVEHDGTISSGYYKDDDGISVDEFYKIEQHLPKITKKRAEEKFLESYQSLESKNDINVLFMQVLNMDYPEFLVNNINENELHDFLNNAYSIRFDAARAFGYGAEKTFDFLNNYYMNNENVESVLKTEWLTRGVTYIEKAGEGAHFDLANRIFNDNELQKVMFDLKDDIKLNKLPNKIVKHDLVKLVQDDKEKAEKLALKIMTSFELKPEKIFSPSETSKSVFNFYSEHFPDFVESLKDSPTQGFLYINNLTMHEPKKNFEENFNIIKELNLNKEQKEKFLDPLENNFNKAIINFSSVDNMDNLTQNFTTLFEHFGKDNLKTCLDKGALASLVRRSHYEGFSKLLEKGMMEHINFTQQNLALFKTEKEICLHNDTEQHLDFIIEKIGNKIKQEKKNNIRKKP